MLCRLAALTSVTFALAVGVAHSGTTTSLYDTLGGVENGGDPLNPVTGAGPILADRFVSLDATHIASVTLNMRLAGAPTGGFQVDLFSDIGTGPGTVVAVIANVLDTSLTSSFNLYTFKPLAPIKLGVSGYYVGVMDTNNSDAVLGNTLSSSVLNRTSVIAGNFYFNNGGLQANSGGPYELNVLAVPEPGAWALTLLGLGTLGGVVRRRRAVPLAA